MNSTSTCNKFSSTSFDPTKKRGGNAGTPNARDKVELDVYSR
jgi:hypothetical protein